LGIGLGRGLGVEGRIEKWKATFSAGVWKATLSAGV